MTQVGMDKQILLRNMLNAPGGDPTYILNMLYDVLVMEQFKGWTKADGTTCSDFSEALTLMGQSWNKIQSLVQIKHSGEERGERDVIERMAELREKVRIESEKAGRPLGSHGTNQHSLGRVATRPEEQSVVRGTTNRPYIIDRLKRDALDIAEQVIAGDFSASEGKRRAIADGRWKVNATERYRIAIRLDDPQSALETIMEAIKRKPDLAESVDELISLLLSAMHGGDV